jgi:TrmH family RNA methyltransferase
MTKTNNAPLSVRNCITSRNHSLVKRIRSLHRREERDRQRKYYIEGMRFVAQAIEASTHIEALVYAPDLIEHPFARHLIKQQQKAGTPCFALADEVMHSIALNDDSQGIGAVVGQRWERLRDINPQHHLCWIVVQTVQSPGNLGTMLRTSEAVGGAGVILLDNYIDVYDPATVRATMAAMFRQRFVRTTLPQLLTWKEQYGCKLVGTSPAASHDYRTVEYSCPTLLFMGGERKGLSQKYQDACDALVKLPMVGRADSLNLAVATGVMLYEIFHQRRKTVR